MPLYPLIFTMSNFERGSRNLSDKFRNRNSSSKLTQMFAATALALITLLSGCHKGSSGNQDPNENCLPTDNNSRMNENQRLAVLRYNQSALLKGEAKQKALFEASRLADQEILNHAPCIKQMEDILRKSKEDLKKYFGE